MRLVAKRRGVGERAVRPALWLRRAGMALIALCLLAACQQDEDATLPPLREEPAQVVADLHLRESEAGRLRWVLQADTAFSYGEHEPTQLYGVAIDFYDDTGDTIRSTLTAREGEVRERSHAFLARGEVVVESRAGHVLETEELRWDPEAEKVVSDRFVRLTKGTSVLTGVGIESDPQLRVYRILSEVEAGVREEDAATDEL